MSRNVLVSDIMTREVTCAGLNNKLSQVLEFFTKFKIQHLPVIEDKEVVGIISVNDMVWFMNDHLRKSETITQTYLDESFSIESLMTKNPVTLSPHAPIAEAFKILAPGDFQCIIITEDGDINGIITNKDLVRYHARGFNTNHEDFTIGTAGYGI
ncbi:MAG: HPP family protein [Bacteroidia bacterium]